MEPVVPLGPAEPLAPAYPTIKESWAALGWLVLINVVTALLLLIPFDVVDHMQGLPKVILLLSIGLISNVIAVYWLRRRVGPKRWPGLPWQGPAEHWALYGLLLLLVPANAVLLSVQWFLHLPDWSVGKQFAELARHPLFALLFGCLGAPITEEVLFRGVLLRGLLRNYRPGLAIVQSALLFGIMHFNPAQSLNAFFMGLLLGWIYYKSHSLWLCIGLHALHNVLAFSARLFPQLASDQHPLWVADRWLYASMVVAALVVLVVVLHTFGRMLRSRRLAAFSPATLGRS